MQGSLRHHGCCIGQLMGHGSVLWQGYSFSAPGSWIKAETILNQGWTWRGDVVGTGLGENGAPHVMWTGADGGGTHQLRPEMLFGKLETQADEGRAHLSCPQLPLAGARHMPGAGRFCSVQKGQDGRGEAGRKLCSAHISTFFDTHTGLY